MTANAIVCNTSIIKGLFRLFFISSCDEKALINVFFCYLRRYIFCRVMVMRSFIGRIVLSLNFLYPLVSISNGRLVKVLAIGVKLMQWTPFLEDGEMTHV